MKSFFFQFYRLNAAGNTFILCDLDMQPFEKSDRPHLVKKLCNEFVGFRSDGFIFLKKINANQVEWDFYNSDGSSAEMCGNATRAVGSYLKLQKPVILKTVIGEVEIGPSGQNQYYARWKVWSEAQWEQEFNYQGYVVTYDYLNTGVPHAVVEMNPYPELANALRHYTAHSSSGMNVTFLESRCPGEVTAVTFERGIEDFTLACGTGAVAAAMWSKELNPELKRHEVQMPGGILIVSFLDNQMIELAGPAQLDFKFEVEL